MLLVAAVCVLAGTWQIARLAGKVGANAELRRNAHAAALPVARLLPVVGQGKRPADHAIQFRRVTATGSYDAAHGAFVRRASVNDSNGYYVLTPLRTSEGTLLVVRGFVASDGNDTARLGVPAPPSGTVTVTARLEPGQTRHDAAAALPGGQVESVNPAEQAGRLGTPVFAAYAELLPGQPGVGSLTAIPDPDLSNPAGGAIEPQHVAYIIQWYLFALLALAAPFAMVRAETRHQHGGEFDDPTPEPAAPAGEPTAEQVRAAKLADRYGRAVR
jgi:cytochrome oxidase assembly protein ShyY1